MSNVKPLNIREFASAIGVSHTTVSKAFSGNGRISPETRATVLEAAERLGFELNPHAQRLSQGGSHDTIALFSLYLAHGVNTRILERIQRRLTEAGFDAPIHAYNSFNEEHPVAQVEALAALRRQKPRALAIFSPGLGRESLRELERYQAEGGVIIAYNEPVDFPCDKVLMDWKEQNSLAVRHLAAQGHTRIGHYKMGSHDPQAVIVRGFRAAMAESGLPVRDEWLFDGGMYGEGGVQLACDYRLLSDRPTAVVVSEETAAATFIAEVQRRGMCVPQDISVIAQTDFTLAPYFTVPITAVRYPTEEIADAVVETLLERLGGAGNATLREIVVPTTLIERGSVGPPP